MVEDTSDNADFMPQLCRLQSPEPVGQAAVVLVESLVHGLVAQRVIDLAEAVKMVGVAIDVISEQAFEVGNDKNQELGALLVLERIRASLAIDLSK